MLPLDKSINLPFSHLPLHSLCTCPTTWMLVPNFSILMHLLAMQAKKLRELKSASQFAQYEGATHVNLIEQLQGLGISDGGSPQAQTYTNGVENGMDHDGDLDDEGGRLFNSLVWCAKFNAMPLGGHSWQIAPLPPKASIKYCSLARGKSGISLGLVLGFGTESIFPRPASWQSGGTILSSYSHEGNCIPCIILHVGIVWAHVMTPAW